MKRNILEDAIADAKTIKESAIENAKLALEEAFTPHLKSMLAAKLEEIELGEEEEEENVEEEYDTMKEEEEDLESSFTEEEEEEFNLDEILAEIEREMDDETEAITEEETEEEETEEEEKETEEEEKETEDETEDEEDFDVGDMTEEEFKAFVASVIDEMNQDGELESESDFPVEGEAEVEDEVDYHKELFEAYKTVKILRNELNEINLLNAKLIYTNKIFKVNNLRESQKIQVLESFDKASTTSEAKVIYETLIKSITPRGKAPIRENKMGSASKSLANLNESKTSIIEVDPMVARFQKLAGIKI